MEGESMRFFRGLVAAAALSAAFWCALLWLVM
jgi:hypothetical protein